MGQKCFRWNVKLVNILKHKYPGVSEQRLLNDVNHTIAYLLNLEMIREVK